MCCKRFLQSTTSAPKAVQTQMLNIKNDNLMTKQRIEIEHELKSTSANIVWKLISTADGYANWLADSVTADGDELTFTWGQEWRHHEQRKAHFVAKERLCRVRFHWDDDPEDVFVEIRMERCSLSGTYSLFITDFSDEDDTEWLYSTWEKNLKRLHETSGV